MSWMMKVLCFLFLVLVRTISNHEWDNPGCHRVGYTRKISVPNCVEFNITTNACRGYCVSYSIPSLELAMENNPRQVVTSLGQCCNIMTTEDVKVDVLCLDGLRQLTFKSAITCSCFYCKRE